MYTMSATTMRHIFQRLFYVPKEELASPFHHRWFGRFASKNREPLPTPSSCKKSIIYE